MRLTLRTMLAHLDGILDPADSEELARKIAENEFASTLAQRITDCTKRLRLGAPKVLGKGTALDPNTVAEYLDSTLAADRMPDFEKVCLESDVHLAEVAACHHILTMIVGQPAQIDPESRRRMYALVSRAAEGVAAEGVAAEGAAAESGAEEMVGAAVRAAESAGLAASETVTDDLSTSVDGFPTQAKPQPRKPQVPDYLREGARQQKMTTAMIFVAAAAIVIAILAFKDPLLRLVGVASTSDNAVSQGGQTEKQAPTQPSAGGAEAQPIEPAEEHRASRQAPSAESKTGEDEAADAAAKAAPDAATVAPLPGERIPPARPAPEPATEAPPTAAPATDEPPPLPTPPGDATAPDQLPAAPPEAPPGEAPRQPEAAPRLDRAEPVGKLVSADQLLLRFDTQAGEGGDWVRVPDGGMVYGGDRVVALPTFRPRLVFAGGLLVELVADSRDGTIVDVLAPDADGTPGLHVVHGRLAKISAPGKQRVPLRIALGKQTAKVTLASTTTALAVSVERPYAPGEDPMAAADPVTATFYATSGAVEVAAAAAPPVTVNEAMQLSVSPAGPQQPQPTSPPPAWLDASDGEWSAAKALDLNAAKRLMQDLTPTASVGVVLAEQFHGRQIEGQSLAARSFGYLGRFDPLVAAALKDENLNWNWRERALEGLRVAIRRGPETAALVRDALVREFGDRNGGAMYRMLCGYSSSDLAGGADSRLVENLDHDMLAFRALAAFNLSSITGRTWNYKPEVSANARREPIARWRGQLQRREIVYRAADTPPARAANGPAAEPPAGAPAADAATSPEPPDAAPRFPPPPPAGTDGR